MLHAFRFLFFRFRPKAYFYGLLALFRNLAICLIPAIVPAEDLGMQIVIICMILLTSGGCRQRANPPNSRENKLGRLCERAALANIPSFRFWGPGNIKNYSFLLLG